MKSIKQSLPFLAALVTTSALLAGCGATIKETGESEGMNPRVEAATAAFGPGFRYMIVGSGNALEDAAFVGLFKPGQESDLSRGLYKRIYEAWSQGERFMVTGANSRKTAHVIIEALSLSPKDGLPGLELLYLGDQQFVQGIEESVIRVGGELRSAPYPG
ncbi:MAG TPA: hypothetical protein VLS27_13280 [Gammaproteobacteria bacterium]|nr:hypothetical protein [Gammaproteobacteria bacterium]